MAKAKRKGEPEGPRRLTVSVRVGPVYAAWLCRFKRHERVQSLSQFVASAFLAYAKARKFELPPEDRLA